MPVRCDRRRPGGPAASAHRHGGELQRVRRGEADPRLRHLGADLPGVQGEIAELVGPENIYTFGLSSEAVINSYARGDYDPAAYLEADPRLKAALDFLVCDEMRTMGDAARLERLHAELQNKDWFMTFPDFADYCATKARMLADLGDEAAWARKALVNIAMAGYFSSDRTIADYDRDIWQVGSAR